MSSSSHGSPPAERPLRLANHQPCVLSQNTPAILVSLGAPKLRTSKLRPPYLFLSLMTCLFSNEIHQTPHTSPQQWLSFPAGCGRCWRAWRAVPRAWVEELLGREDLWCYDEDYVLAAALVWAEGQAEAGGAALPALLNLVAPARCRARQSAAAVRACVGDKLGCVPGRVASAFNADASAVDIGLQRWAVRTCLLRGGEGAGGDRHGQRGCILL